MEQEDFMGTKKNDAESCTLCPAEEEGERAVGRADVFPNPGGIGEKQAAVALVMIREHLPLESILEQANVTAEEFAEWIRDGAFPEYAASLARGFAEADAPYIWDTLLREAKNGNIPAIRLYFDIWSKRQPASASRESAARCDPAVENLRSDLFGL